jgi:hypothetical protein
LDIQIATLSGISSLSARTLIGFSIQNVKNPSSLTESSSFIVQILTNDKTYTVNYRDTGLTVTNSLRGSITSASAVPQDTGLSVSTTYDFLFTNTNSIPVNGFIQVGIPNEITVPSGTTTLPCTTTLTVFPVISNL